MAVLKLALAALAWYCCMGAKRRGGLKTVTVNAGFSVLTNDQIASSDSFFGDTVGDLEVG